MACLVSQALVAGLVLYLSFLIALVQVMTNLASPVPSTAPSHSKRVVCYYSNWAQYRPSPGTFVVNNIDPFICTHVLFAFAQLQGNAVVPYEFNDDTYAGMWRQAIQLKTINPNLKVLLALGGYSHGPARFSAMSATPENRANFISSLIIVLIRWGFDGCDVDWEYPSAADKTNFSLLIKELREAFEKDAVTNNRERLILAAATPAGIDKIEDGYDIPFLDNYLDFYNIMCYDYHGQWENVTGLASPINAPDGDLLSVTMTLDHYIARGASRLKINLGLGFYARTWTTASFGAQEVGSPAISGGLQGPFTREGGVLSYYEVCNLLKSGYTEAFHQLGQVMYAFKDNQWVTYENQETLGFKVDLILAYGLGGAMVWALDHDDFGGQFCGDGSYPLLSLVSRRIINAPDVPPTSGSTLPSTTTSTSTSPSITVTPTTTETPSTTTTTTTPTTTTNTATTVNQRQTTIATAAPTTSASNSGNSPKTFSCPQPNGPFPHPSSCTLYFFCKSNLAFSNRCQNGQVYSPIDRVCVEPTKYTCPY